MPDRVPIHILLPERLDSMGKQVRARLCEDQQVAGLGLAWGYVAGELRKALEAVLDCDLAEMLARIWARAAPLAELAAGRQAPGQRRMVELGKHEVVRDFHPIVAVTVGSCPCVELEFKFAVTLRVGSVRLAVVDGHIVGGDLGEVWGSAQLSYRDVPLHAAAETRKLPLPASFELAAPGIAILPRLESA